MLDFQLLLLMLAPAMVVALLYLGARVRLLRRPTINRKAISAGLGVACVGFCAYDLYLYFAIVDSERSMAVPGGLMELMIVGPVVWLAAFAVGWSAGILMYSVRARREEGPEWAPGIGARIRTAVAIAIVVVSVGYAGARGYSRALWHRATSAQSRAVGLPQSVIVPPSVPVPVSLAK